MILAGLGAGKLPGHHDADARLLYILVHTWNPCVGTGWGKCKREKRGFEAVVASFPGSRLC